MIIIVTIGNDQYVADVGFGGNGQIHPLILDKSGTVTAGILPASKRILWRNINQNTDPNQRMWVFEHRNDDDSEWEETYCFTDLEFLPADYGMYTTKASSL